MKKQLLLQILLILLPLCLYAQNEGKIKYGEYASYKGIVSKNKPMGEGVLTYKWKESTFAVKMIDKITGNFSNRIVENATVTFAARGCSYKGKLRFDVGERGKLTITMINGVLNLKGNEYSVKNEIYQADGEKSICGFGSLDISGSDSYIKTGDYEIKETMLTIYNKNILNKKIELPIQAKSYVFLAISTSTDRYEGCRLEIKNKIIGYREDELTDITFDGNICTYISPSKKTTISCTGFIKKNRDTYFIDANNIQFTRKLYDGTFIEGKEYEPSINRLQGQDTDYSTQELFTGKITYSNGNIYNGKFILDSEGCKSFLDMIENVSLQNLALGSGVTSTVAGERIISKSIHEKRRDEIIAEIQKCDSLWSLKMSKSNMSVIKKHLEGKTFIYKKKIVKDNYMFTIGVNFLSEKVVKLKAGLIALTEKAVPVTKQELGVLLGMFNSISENIDYVGEYVLIDGYIYLRRDNKTALEVVSNKEVINSADVYSTELHLNEEKTKLQKFAVYNNFQLLKSKQSIPLVSEEQIYNINIR